MTQAIDCSEVQLQFDFTAWRRITNGYIENGPKGFRESDELRYENEVVAQGRGESVLVPGKDHGSGARSPESLFRIKRDPETGRWVSGDYQTGD